jgi:CPA2 family monovalent cation:H+ antiporter-2
MIEGAWVKDLLILLVTAGIVVPLFWWLRVGPVLGFLVAGVALGPGGLGNLVGRFPWLQHITFADPERVQPFAELGILFLLFLIGLEFSLDRLWRMRRFVLGVGTGQVFVSAALIIAGVAMLSGHFTTGLVIGLALALSSTAIVTQVLIEARRFGAPVGRLAIGVLIFQDLMVVPIVILVGFLGGDEVALPAKALRSIAISAAALALIWVAGRYLVGPLLRLAGATGSRELVVAIGLLVAIGTAMITSSVGLSPALGAFLAGLLLGGSEYRHQIEVDIEPFKGLLLGLFFMTIGMSIDVAAVAGNPFPIVVGLVGLLVAKGLAAFAVARLFRIEEPVAIEAALLLAGAGEFAFVVFNLAGQDSLIPPHIEHIVVSAAALSMILTPALASIGRRLATRRGDRISTERHGIDEADEESFSDHVVIAGFGRVGETVASLLQAEAFDYVALDLDADRVARLREAGKPVFFGDASRGEILAKIGGASARAFVLTTDDPDVTERTVKTIREAWPDKPIHARAIDRAHARALAAMGVDDVVPEAFEGSLQLAAHVLDGLGLPEEAIDTRLEVARESEMRKRDA